MDLTILIPTFDRPNEVNQRLDEISDEFGSGISVVVQVNPGQYAATDISRKTKLTNLVIRENASNIGFIANIVSGMISVHTEWVWVLGDDDPIRPGSREEINASIQICEQEHADLTVFNQFDQLESRQEKVCRNIDDFVKSTGFSDCLFISALVWKTSYLAENLGILIDYSFTRVSQAMIQLCTLASGRSTIYVRDQKLINHVEAYRWSRLDYLQRVDKIFYDPRLTKYKTQVFKFMLNQVSWALRSSLAEIDGWAGLIKWMLLASKYTFQVFRILGLRAGIRFTRLLGSDVISHVNMHGKVRQSFP